MKISTAVLADWPNILKIYQEGIRTELATFETEVDIPDGATWFAGKIKKMVFKAVDEKRQMLGWCALSSISRRRVYAGVAEVSVYVDTAVHNQGIGSALLSHLIAASEAAGFWTLQASIFPKNEASIHLHLKHGFRRVGIRHKLGKLHGVWRDVVFLERRSLKVC